MALEGEPVRATPEQMLMLFGRVEKLLEKIESNTSGINEQMALMVDAMLGLSDTNHEDLERLSFAIGQVMVHVAQGGSLDNLLNRILQAGKSQPPAKGR